MTVGDFLKEKIFLTAKQFVHVTYYVYDVTYFDLVEAIVDIDFCCYLNRLWLSVKRQLNTNCLHKL